MKKLEKAIKLLTAVSVSVSCLISIFYGETGTVSVDAAQKSAVYQKYDKEIDKRVKAIKEHKTDIETVGTVYYVSSSTGNDDNDGLSPETAWKTCKRVNEDPNGVIYDGVKKNGGATVLFKRGDTWKRDGIGLWYPNMVYSTYGTGAKPVFDFSLADAADPAKWTLKKGTKNIWIYKDKVPFLGSLTLNNKFSADNYVGYYDYRTKKWYESCPNGHYKDDKYCCNYKKKKYLNINKLPSNSFFVDVRPSKKYLDKTSGDLYVYDCEQMGTLYFNCKKGNPGKVYKSIQLCQGWGLSFGNNCVIDDLVVKNTGNQAIANMVDENAKGCTLQNCEVYFCGDTYISFSNSEHRGMVGGECSGFHGPGARYYNNYFYGSREGGFTVELGWTGALTGENKNLGDVRANGNVFDKCDGGIGVICFTELAKGVDMSNIMIDNNYFREIGCAHDANSMGDDVHSLGILHIWDHSGDVNMSQMVFSNNLILYTDDRVINLEQTKRRKMMIAKNNTVILKKKSGMHFLRVTDRKWHETYYDTVAKAKPYLGTFGKVKWVD